MNKAAGFITIHRQILDWEWYKDTNTVCLFFHLLLNANFVDGRFEGKVIKRGQLVTSLPSLSAETGLSIQQVRTALSHLKSTGEITDEANRRYRVITISKYDDYQTPTDELTGKQQTTNRLSTDNQQAVNRQLTGCQQQYNNNNNNNKVTKKQGNNNTPLANTDDFYMFWDNYPKKVAKQAAVKAWKKLNPDHELAEKIAIAVQRWKRTDEWRKEGGQFVPYPATWLNGRRWEDEIPENKPAQAPVKAIAAQQYTQRSYGGEQEDAMRRMVAAAGWVVES